VGAKARRALTVGEESEEDVPARHRGMVSDRIGRKWLIAGGMWLVGTAMVYPSLLAAIGDVAHPSWRASAVGVYRLWRDPGYAIGAVLDGVTADAAGCPAPSGWSLPSPQSPALSSSPGRARPCDAARFSPGPPVGQTGGGIVTRLFDEQKREIAVLGRLASLRGQRVLDVGCGNGRMTMLIAEIAGSVVGIDPDADAIEEARKKVADARCESVSLVAEDVNTVSAPWLAAFDVVVFSRSL
jgi:hypothetical protein